MKCIAVIFACLGNKKITCEQKFLENFNSWKSFPNFLAQVKIANGGVLNALPSDDHLTKSHLPLGKAWDEVRKQTVASDRSNRHVIFTNSYKVGCVFPMVIWSEFCLGSKETTTIGMKHSTL